jgi:hypothetical protein
VSGSTLKCVVCHKPAEYVILGYSYCGGCAKERIKEIGEKIGEIRKILRGGE